MNEETVNAELKVGAGKVEDEQVEDEQVDEVWLTTPQCVQHSLRHTLPVHTAHWVTDKTLKTPSLRYVQDDWNNRVTEPLHVLQDKK